MKLKAATLYALQICAIYVGKKSLSGIPICKNVHSPTFPFKTWSEPEKCIRIFPRETLQISSKKFTFALNTAYLKVGRQLF